MDEKGFDFSFAHLLWVALVVKQNVTANSLHVSFFGAVGVEDEWHRVPGLTTFWEETG
jgi:hypothetical protein